MFSRAAALKAFAYRFRAVTVDIIGNANTLTPATGRVLYHASVIPGLCAGFEIRILPNGAQRSVTAATGFATVGINAGTVAGRTCYLVHRFPRDSIATYPSLNKLYTL